MLYQESREREFSIIGSSLETFVDKLSMRAVQWLYNRYPQTPCDLKVVQQSCYLGFPVSDVQLFDRFGKHTLFAVNLTKGKAELVESHLQNRKTQFLEPHIALPLGPVYGNYYHGDPVETRALFYLSNGRESFGDDDVIDRFPGREKDINTNFSGGLALGQDGLLELVNQRQMMRRVKRGFPGAQTFYSWNSNNAEGLMQERWTHFGQDQKIGDSVYIWSWYLQTGDTVMFVAPKYKVVGNNHFPLDYINYVNDLLSEGEYWKAALVDSGLGGGFSLSNGNGNIYSNHPHPEYFHSVPVFLRVSTTESNFPEAGAKKVTRTSVLDNLDSYFRRSDTLLAKVVNKLSSKQGAPYVHSRRKRLLDLAISIPASAIATPIIGLLGGLKKLEDGGPMFFSHERLTPGGLLNYGDENKRKLRIKVLKLRSMRQNSDSRKEVLEYARGRPAWQDPRSTNFGVFIRKYDLDELPQLYQVVRGDFSILGVRTPAEYAVDTAKESWSPKRFKKWQQVCGGSRFGLSGANQIFGKGLKEDEKRFHWDMFYAQNANLGLDLYLIYRTLRRVLRFRR